MRKIIFAILAVVLLIFTGFVIYRGTNIGKFEIWGIKQINEENEQIDRVNAELGSLVDISYPGAVTKLNNSGETMEETKREYEEQVTMLSNSKYYMQTEKYKLEFLWTKIGNYAKDNKVTPKMQVTNGSTNEIYNLTISAIGRYSNVASFIYAIENDSRLGFKIEDFKMVQAEDGYVQGTFTCKEIRIDLKSIDKENNTDGKNTTNTESRTNTNNTNSTNTNTTDNNTTNNITTENNNTTNNTANTDETDTTTANTTNANTATTTEAIDTKSE